MKTLFIHSPQSKKRIFRLAGQSCFNTNFKAVGEKGLCLCELAIGKGVKGS